MEKRSCLVMVKKDAEMGSNMFRFVAVMDKAR